MTPSSDSEDGPDPELGRQMLAAIARIDGRPEDRAPLRRLVRLLQPGISPFHERHAELAAIFARVREDLPLSNDQRTALTTVGRAEAAFLITGAV
ncbi:MAG: hypothetical protein JO021_18485 [Alphaproteobacteria bacterium]|nr:hypothetical protein [Alphaproteobacteria bacterium]